MRISDWSSDVCSSDLNADFDGDWSVEWCDKTHPGSDCGGFNITLVQQDDRICGTYSGANAGLSQIDAGSPRAILGAVVRNVAIIAILCTRSAGISIVLPPATDGYIPGQDGKQRVEEKD